MNLRTLKKLSKRAARYLPILGDNRQQFPAIGDENYHHAFIGAPVLIVIARRTKMKAL